MEEDTNPQGCKDCRQMELANASLGLVAKHWVLSHPSYLQVLQAALTIYQSQQVGVVEFTYDG